MQLRGIGYGISDSVGNLTLKYLSLLFWKQREYKDVGSVERLGPKKTRQKEIGSKELAPGRGRPGRALFLFREVDKPTSETFPNSNRASQVPFPFLRLKERERFEASSPPVLQSAAITQYPPHKRYRVN